MTIFCFLGPSLNPSDLPEIDQSVIVMPPAKRGDIAKIELFPNDVVLLIDGIIVSDHSPSIRECYSVIERGARLIGASSIGALRALELSSLGAVGIGWVYESLRNRTITADDELVAVLEPNSYQPRTILLANVRYALDILVKTSTISRNCAQNALDSISSLNFAIRTRENVFQCLINSGLTVAESNETLSDKFNIKRHDAMNAIRAVLDYESV